MANQWELEMSDQQETNYQASQDSAAQLQAGPGQRLRAVREAKNLSLQDISKSLRYSAKQIDALENNQFDALPDPMMTRGFIRSYAKYLEIEAEPLIKSYRQLLGEDEENVIALQSSMHPVSLTKPTVPWLKYVLASIVVLLFVLAWLMYVDYMPKQGAVESSSLPAEAGDAVVELPAVTEPLPEVALPIAERNDTDLAVEPQPSVPTESAANPTAALALNPVTKTAPAPANVAAAPLEAPTEIKLSNSLVMKFTADSWVRLTDKNAKVIYEKMLHSGDVETIQVSPPISILIGNAAATTMVFNGKQIDLSGNTKNNVARIALE